MLLILDLDETLIHAVERAPGAEAIGDFSVGGYDVRRRPHLEPFLKASVVRAILPPGLTPAFAWGRGRCTRRPDSESFEDVFIKDLKKVRRLGFNLSRTLIVDDTPAKVARNYGNAVYVPPFLGDPSDDVLPMLTRYLDGFREAVDVRTLEKRGWCRRPSS